MAERAARFAEKATANQLKDKLTEFGLNTVGVKTTLKSRLFEAINKMSDTQLNEHFPINLLNLNDEVNHGADRVNLSDEAANAENHNFEDIDDDEELNNELESLRNKFQKKQEIAELKRKIAELSRNDDTVSENSRPFFSFRDVEESFTQFSGDDNYCIEKWMQNFEESAETLGWDPRTCFIHAKRLMKGTAKLFLRTTSLKSWSELKSSLLKEFSTTISNAEIHNLQWSRKKKKDESWQQYIFIMQELASLSTIDEADLVQYIISGISDTAVNKILLFGANNLADLKGAFKKYERMKSTGDNFSSRCDMEPVQQSRTSGKARCFNCNEFGHISSKCTKPKRDKGSCFRCGKMGHKAPDCNLSRPPVMNVESSSSSREKTIHLQQPALQQRSHKQISFSVTNSFEFNIRYSIDSNDDKGEFSCSLLTLPDSGSGISFIQQQYLSPYLVKTADSEKYRFHSINQSRLKIVGTTLLDAVFMNNSVSLDLFFVEDTSMLYPVILEIFYEKII